MAMQRTGSFADLLRHHRRVARLTQEQLAEKSGLSTRTIQDLEAGRVQRPRRDSVDLLAAALGLPEPERELLVHIGRLGGAPLTTPVPSALPLLVISPSSSTPASTCPLALLAALLACGSCHHRFASAAAHD
jgi:transcriptional regulator with XRE-family HTH domain